MPAEGSGEHGLDASSEREKKSMSASSKSTRVDETKLAAITTGPLPGSRKVHVIGSRYPFLRVPLREIAQTATRHSKAGAASDENPPVAVYDTSGPYSDAEAEVDVRRGLEPLRTEWIRRREDTDELAASSSAYARARRGDAKL